MKAETDDSCLSVENFTILLYRKYKMTDLIPSILICFVCNEVLKDNS